MTTFESTRQASDTRLALLALVVIASIIAAAQLWTVVTGVTVKPQRWQYAVEGPSDDQLVTRLQQLGEAGWEIVSARRATSEQGGKTAGMYEMIMRRPIGVIDAVPPFPTPK